jgi:hypothetical protein
LFIEACKSKLIDPGQIWLLFFEISAYHFHQNGKWGLGFKATGFFQGENAFHPAQSLIAPAAKAAFSPQHNEMQGTFGPLNGRLYIMLIQKGP